ncbi:MAG: ECF transporter S component [Firmicutes bacterium]|nr:ECF transporter S component [Bacillota bacterium]
MKLHNLVRGALLLALGVVLPFLFHSTGIAGPVFLPMHIPVLLAGFLVCPWAGIYVGLFSPLISHFITGGAMPPMAPVPQLIFMMVELPVLGLFAALLYRKLKLNISLALPGALIAGRIALGLAVWVFIGVLGYEFAFTPLAFVTTAITTGIPGIAIQLAIIPILVHAVERRRSPWAEISR